jgi:hypothetical protein
MNAIYFSPSSCTQAKCYILFVLLYYIYIIDALFFVKSFFFYWTAICICDFFKKIVISVGICFRERIVLCARYVMLVLCMQRDCVYY